MSQRQKQILRQSLSLKQYIEMNFGNFISKPEAICPECGHRLKKKEIIEGFSDNPHELRTTCPKCGHQFLATLIISNPDSKEEIETVSFICPVQTLEKMSEIKKQRGRLGVTYLAKNNRELFYNMIRHWGTYPKAIKALKQYM